MTISLYSAVPVLYRFLSKDHGSNLPGTLVPGTFSLNEYGRLPGSSTAMNQSFIISFRATGTTSTYY